MVVHKGRLEEGGDQLVNSVTQYDVRGNSLLDVRAVEVTVDLRNLHSQHVTAVKSSNNLIIWKGSSSNSFELNCALQLGEYFFVGILFFLNDLTLKNL